MEGWVEIQENKKRKEYHITYPNFYGIFVCSHKIHQILPGSSSVHTHITKNMLFELALPFSSAQVPENNKV